MANILVTGGTGFIGSNLAQRLVADGHDVVITGTQTENRTKATILEPGLQGIDWKKLQRIDVLFHQAANNDTTCVDRDAMMHANLHASKTLFQHCLDIGCRHFVFASSTAVYGDAPAPYLEEKTPLKPLNVYGESKVRLEEFALRFAEQHEVDTVGLRYCNVYGPGETHKGKRASMIFQMAQARRQGRPIRLFKWGEQRRDFIFVEDVVEANLAAWAKKPIRDVYNCGSGSCESFADLARLVQQGLGLEVLTPEWIENPHADFYQTHTQCDMTKARDSLGFVPKFTIAQGVERFMKSLSE